MSNRDSSLGRLREHRRALMLDDRVKNLVSKSRSSWPSWFQIAMQWIVIAGALGAATASHSWLIRFIAFAVIGTRQHALLVLMHDGAHRLLCIGRQFNDILSNLTLAFPLLISTGRYREHHFRHHSKLNSDSDPDREDGEVPSRAFDFLILLLKDISGLSTLKTLGSMSKFGVFGLWSLRDQSASYERKLFMVFCGIALTSVSFFDAWAMVLIFWIGPMIFVLPGLLRIRGVAEHAGSKREQLSRSDARSISANWLEKIFFAPCNVNRHWEHHLFPQVPSYRLERLALAIRAADAGSGAPLNSGYFMGKYCLYAELFSSRKSDE